MPAVRMPAQRVPGMPRAPRGRSRQPMARIIAPAAIFRIPAGERIVRVLSGVISRTWVSSRQAIPAAVKAVLKRSAYSGPLSSAPK